MTPKELDDFIEHGEKHISHFIIVFGEEWVRHAIQIASELRHRLAHPKQEWQGLTTQEIADETDIATSSNKDIFDFRKAFWCGARWAEAKLKEKNSGC